MKQLLILFTLLSFFNSKVEAGFVGYIGPEDYDPFTGQIVKPVESVENFFGQIEDDSYDPFLDPRNLGIEPQIVPAENFTGPVVEDFNPFIEKPNHRELQNIIQDDQMYHAIQDPFYENLREETAQEKIERIITLNKQIKQHETSIETLEIEINLNQEKQKRINDEIESKRLIVNGNYQLTDEQKQNLRNEINHLESRLNNFKFEFDQIISSHNTYLNKLNLLRKVKEATTNILNTTFEQQEEETLEIIKEETRTQNIVIRQNRITKLKKIGLVILGIALTIGANKLYSNFLQFLS